MGDLRSAPQQPLHANAAFCQGQVAIEVYRPAMVQVVSNCVNGLELVHGELHVDALAGYFIKPPNSRPSNKSIGGLEDSIEPTFVQYVVCQSRSVDDGSLIPKRPHNAIRLQGCGEVGDTHGRKLSELSRRQGL